MTIGDCFLSEKDLAFLIFFTFFVVGEVIFKNIINSIMVRNIATYTGSHSHSSMGRVAISRSKDPSSYPRAGRVSPNFSGKMGKNMELDKSLLQNRIKIPELITIIEAKYSGIKWALHHLI